MEILNAHKVVDIPSRALQHGFIAASAPQPARDVAPPATLAAGAVSGEEVLGLAEEQLSVGKRLVREGTTRIRRFVTERPVEAQVTLHEEHAQVIRRAVSDPNFMKNIDWADETVEITETAEEAVVTKTARIAEEVVIRKEGADYVKTVRDKVRRQQVEIERVAGGSDPAPRKKGPSPQE
jgi:uncharacterized protein (TIGR02271 family)